MSKEILVNIGEGERRVAILANGKLDDFHIEIDRHNSILGNIYKGKVESILPSINGAFVDIGEGKNGFLYLTDAINPLIEEELSGPKKFLKKFFNKHEKPTSGAAAAPASPVPPPLAASSAHKPPQFTKGEEILVQVVKEPFGNKGARLTTHISLAGRFLVYMPFDENLGVSKRIEDVEERHRLKDLLRELNEGKKGGFIVRTVSSNKSKKELLHESRFLTNIWQKIKKMADEKTAPSLIYKEYDLLWRIVRDFLTEEVGKLLIDSPEEFNRLRRFVYTLVGREMVNKIHLYKGDAPIFEAQNVSKELSKIYDTKVYLKSGAYVVIEPTEGLTVVDVNSGRFKANAPPEEAAFAVNCEAAPEIARQLRLRDLGGIIVIDFIDMVKDSHKRKVLHVLEEALSKDRAKTEVLKISPLGLVEMTRERTGKTIESMSFHACPYCDGRGRIKID